MSGLISKIKNVVSGDKEPAATDPNSTLSAAEADEQKISTSTAGTMEGSETTYSDDPLAAAEADGKKRLSTDHGLDASKHKPSHFAHKMGSAEVAHAGDSSHQRRHGSIVGHEHYGSGIQ